MAALKISWKKKEGRSICLFSTKHKSTLTGHQYNLVRGVEEFEMSQSAYDDDAAFLFSSQEEAKHNTLWILQNCSNWGIDVHHGLLATENKKRKDFKTELLFMAKPSQS
eukprot:9899182-Ditylum_brightwellii.AAC.1